MKNKKQKIDNAQPTLIILSNFDLDKRSGASWNRALCYSKAISEAGVKVIITSSKYKTADYSQPIKFEDNIYLLKSKSVRHFPKKTIPILYELNFRIVLKYMRELLITLEKTNRNVIYLLYPSNFSFTFISLFYLKLYKRKTVYVEANELYFAKALNFPMPVSIFYKFFYPFIWILNIAIGFFIDFFHIFFDGMICISTRMEKLYRRFNTSLIRIPILTYNATSYSSKEQFVKSNSFQIAYTGTINEKRDGVFSFIKSISYLNTEETRCKVNLYGPITNSGKHHLDSIIYKYKLSGVINYHGNLEAADIPEILSSQDLLVLPRPINLQTNFGFSTKLAEYLNSGIPVLSSKISDAELYLTDEKNIYFSDSLKPEKIAEKIAEIIRNKDSNIKIALQAKEVCRKHFYYKNYSNALFNFFFNDLLK